MNSTVNYTWNPGGLRFAFVLDDPLIDEDKSHVTANVNGYDCSVTAVHDGWFLLICDRAPREGATLRYAVISAEPLPFPGQRSEKRAIENQIKEGFENMTSQGSIANVTTTMADSRTFG